MRRAVASPFAGAAAVAGPLPPVPAYGGGDASSTLLASAHSGGSGGAAHGTTRSILAGLDSGWRMASDPSLRGGGGYLSASWRGPASYDGGVDVASSPMGGSGGVATHFAGLRPLLPGSARAAAAPPAAAATASQPDAALAEATVALMDELWCVFVCVWVCEAWGGVGGRKEKAHSWA
jgi:hypothetical protein